MAQQQGDTPAGMPGGKAALRQQMFEMARQPLGEEELESVVYQAQAAPDLLLQGGIYEK